MKSLVEACLRLPAIFYDDEDEPGQSLDFNEQHQYLNPLDNSPKQDNDHNGQKSQSSKHNNFPKSTFDFPGGTKVIVIDDERRGGVEVIPHDEDVEQLPSPLSETVIIHPPPKSDKFPMTNSEITNLDTKFKPSLSPEVVTEPGTITLKHSHSKSSITNTVIIHSPPTQPFSLAAPKGRKVTMIEDDETGGVEIVPLDTDTATDADNNSEMETCAERSSINNDNNDSGVKGISLAAPKGRRVTLIEDDEYDGVEIIPHDDDCSSDNDSDNDSNNSTVIQVSYDGDDMSSHSDKQITSLAAPKGRRVTMIENDEIGGVEIIPHDSDSDSDSDHSTVISNYDGSLSNSVTQPGSLAARKGRKVTLIDDKKSVEIIPHDDDEDPHIDPYTICYGSSLSPDISEDGADHSLCAVHTQQQYSTESPPKPVSEPAKDARTKRLHEPTTLSRTHQDRGEECQQSVSFEQHVSNNGAFSKYSNEDGPVKQYDDFTMKAVSSIPSVNKLDQDTSTQAQNMNTVNSDYSVNTSKIKNDTVDTDKVTTVSSEISNEPIATCFPGKNIECDIAKRDINNSQDTIKDSIYNGKKRCVMDTVDRDFQNPLKGREIDTQTPQKNVVTAVDNSFQDTEQIAQDHHMDNVTKMGNHSRDKVKANSHTDTQKQHKKHVQTVDNSFQDTVKSATQHRDSKDTQSGKLETSSDWKMAKDVKGGQKVVISKTHHKVEVIAWK